MKMLKDFFSAPFYPDEESARRANLLSFLLNLHIGVATGTTILSAFFSTTFVYSLVALFAVLLGIGMRLLLRRSHLMLASSLFLGMAFLLMPVVTFSSGSSASGAVVTAFQMMTVVMAGLLLGGFGGWLFVILTVTVNGILIHAELNGLYTVDLKRNPVYTWIMQIVIFSAVAALLYVTNRLIISYSARAQRENEERHAAEARLRGIFENSPDIIFEIDRNGKILFANRYAETYVGNMVFQLVPPEYHQQIEAGIEQLFKTGQRTEFEFMAKEINGLFEWNSIHVGPLRVGGEVTSLVAVITNIHKQKEAAAQVKQRAERLATIVEINHAVSTLKDLDEVLEIIYQQVQRIATVDVFMISLLDKEKNELSFPITYDEGVRYDEPNVSLRPTSRLAKVMMSGKPDRLHRTPEQIAEAEKDGAGMGNMKRKSGSLLFIPLWQANDVMGVLSIQSYSLNAYPDELVETLVGVADQVAIAIQNARLFMNIQQELADRKQAERQIKQRLQELAAIHAVSQATSSILEFNTLFELVSNELFHIFDIQEIYFALYNRQTDQVDFPYYRNSDQKIEADPVPYGQGLSSRVIMTRQPLLINQDYARRSEELGVVRYNPGQYDISRNSWLGVPIQVGEQVIGMICVMNLERENAFTESDVRLLTTIAANVGISIQNAQLYTTIQQELSERKRAEEAREKLISELEQKNAELERFTYTVSHDLKSPIVTIKGFVGMLSKDLQENRPDRVQSDLHRIESATDKMDALLKDLLELSRIGRIVNPPVEIDTVRLIRDAQESLDAKIRSKNVTVNILPGLPQLYGDRIRLREVFENLIGNAAKYMGDQTDPLIEIGVKEQGDEQVFYVKDNGMGIDARYHARIFNLFEKLNPAIEGTGIGLTIVKRIIEVHGGKIWVESDGLEKGSTFCFTLPQK